MTHKNVTNNGIRQPNILYPDFISRILLQSSLRTESEYTTGTEM